jgi:hypothetical protein
MYVTCLIHLTLLDMVTLIISGEEYKLRSSLLSSFASPNATFSLSGPKFLSALIPFSQTSSTYVLLSGSENFFLRLYLILGGRLLQYSNQCKCPGLRISTFHQGSCDSESWWFNFILFEFHDTLLMFQKLIPEIIPSQKWEIFYEDGSDS